ATPRDAPPPAHTLNAYDKALVEDLVPAQHRKSWPWRCAAQAHAIAALDELEVIEARIRTGDLSVDRLIRLATRPASPLELLIRSHRGSEAGRAHLREVVKAGRERARDFLLTMARALDAGEFLQGE